MVLHLNVTQRQGAARATGGGAGAWAGAGAEAGGEDRGGLSSSQKEPRHLLLANQRRVQAWLVRGTASLS